MSTSDDVLIDFVNWWDGWHEYEDLPEDSQEFVDKFLADHYPWRTTKTSPKVAGEVRKVAR